MALVTDGAGKDQDRVDGVDPGCGPYSGHDRHRVVDAAAPTGIETHIAEAAFHALLEHLRLVAEEVGGVGHLEADASGNCSDEQDGGPGAAAQSSPGEKGKKPWGGPAMDWCHGQS